MKEIKFRGKRKYNEEWVYGYYIKTQHCSPAKESDLCVNHWIVDKFGVKHPVHSDTVAQYTNMTDRNGKEIYDKMRVGFINDDCDGTVYQSENGMWMIRWDDGDETPLVLAIRRKDFIVKEEVTP